MCRIVVSLVVSLVVSMVFALFALLVKMSKWPVFKAAFWQICQNDTTTVTPQDTTTVTPQDTTTVTSLVPPCPHCSLTGLHWTRHDLTGPYRTLQDPTGPYRECPGEENAEKTGKHGPDPYHGGTTLIDHVPTPPYPGYHAPHPYHGHAAPSSQARHHGFTRLHLVTAPDPKYRLV